MAHPYPVLITDSFILYTRAIGEADRIITVLTEQGGVLDIYARSIRKEEAKMRETTLPYGRVRLSAVLGKQAILKDITVTDSLENIWASQEKYTTLVCLLRRIHALIPPLGSGDKRIFSIVETATHTLQTSAANHADTILLIAEVLILDTLGYVQTDYTEQKMFSDLLEEATASNEKKHLLRSQLQTALHHQ